MSVKHALLALLAQGRRYGYQLKTEFEQRTASMWPLNIGQVYTTIARHERDGFVRADGIDDRGHAFYTLTEAGQTEVGSWLQAPVARESVARRDELTIKLALGITGPGVDVGALIERQRLATTAAMQDYARRARAVEKRVDFDLAQWLVLSARESAASAELRWLDSVSRLVDAQRGE